MLAPLQRNQVAAAVPLPPAFPAFDLGPAVMADNPCDAARLGADPAYATKAFTGREWDPETGLYYYRARYYSPSLGRFISEDPLGAWDDLNLHRYVRNSPNGFTDPLGLTPTCACARLEYRGESRSGWNAGVCCKDGQFVICVNGPNWRGFGPRQRKCIREHEESHIEEYKHEGRTCGAPPCEMQGASPGEDAYRRWAKSECAAFLREVACLKGSTEKEPTTGRPAYEVAKEKMRLVCEAAKRWSL